MSKFDRTLLLRAPVALILLAHGLPGMLDGGVHAFGTLYLDKVGFAPFGLPLAWAIKLSHLAAAACLLANRWLWPAIAVTNLVLLAGIFMVHLPNGWYVVGGGRNGIEFNVLLLFVLTYLGLAQRADAASPPPK